MNGFLWRGEVKFLKLTTLPECWRSFDAPEKALPHRKTGRIISLRASVMTVAAASSIPSAGEKGIYFYFILNTHTHTHFADTS